MYTTETRIAAADLLTDYEPDDCQALAEEFSCYARLLVIVGLAKMTGQSVPAWLAAHLMHGGLALRDRLQDMLEIPDDGGSTLPLVNEDELCRGR